MLPEHLRLLLCLYTFSWLLAVGESCSFSNGILDLSNNSLTGYVDDTVFASCVVNASSVLEVNMAFNQVTGVDPNTFAIFYNLKRLNISNNAIGQLSNTTFRSLTALEILDVSYNMVVKLEAGLLDLYHLREVYLQHNNISEVEVGIVSEANHNLLIFDISYNSLTVLEPWPYLTKLTDDWYIDRIFNLQHNKIKRITNNMNWTHNLTWPFQVILNVQYNEIEELSTDTMQQFTSDTDLYELFAKFLSMKVNATHNPYFCNCNLYVFANILHDSLYYWKDVEDYRYRCASPVELNGVDWFHDLDLDHLVCNITETAGCPTGCYCQDRPHNDTFYVNCNSAGLTAMPSTIPYHNRSKIELFLDNNNIETLDTVSYLGHIYNMSIQNNKIHELNATVVQELVTIANLDLRSNSISNLPRDIQRLNYGSVHLRGNPLQCDCDSTWLADWVKLYADKADLEVTCASDNGEHRLIDVSDSELDCTNEGWIILGVVIGLTALIAVGFSAFFKFCPYETKVLLHKLLRIHPADKYVVDDDTSKKVDLYLVYDIEDVDVRGWIRHFTKKLHRKKPLYSILNPCRFTEGGSESDNYFKWIQKCRRVIVLLSDNLFTSEWQTHMIDIAENYVTEAQTMEHTGRANSEANLNSIENAVSSAAEIIYIIYNKESEVIKRTVNEEPWKSRLTGKTVLTCGQKMFWSKLRYELPKKGNGRPPDGNFVPPVEDGNGNNTRAELDERPPPILKGKTNGAFTGGLVPKHVNPEMKNKTDNNKQKNVNRANLANVLHLDDNTNPKDRINVAGESGIKLARPRPNAKLNNLEQILKLEPVKHESGGKVSVHKPTAGHLTQKISASETRMQKASGRLSTFHFADEDSTSLGDISMA